MEEAGKAEKEAPSPMISTTVCCLDLCLVVYSSHLKRNENYSGGSLTVLKHSCSSYVFRDPEIVPFS